MVLKILTRKNEGSYKQLLDYLLNDKERIKHKGKGFVIRHNLRGRTTKEMANFFVENEKNRITRRSNATKISHVILSLSIHDREQVTAEKLEAIARKYIELRNPNGIHFSTAHFEKKAAHIHFASSHIELGTGKSMRLSRSELHQLKTDLQDWQKERFPELNRSIVEHGKKAKERAISSKEYQLNKRTPGKTDKDKLSQLLESCYKKAKSQEHFYELLNNQETKTYIRGGRVYGIWYNNRKFRFAGLGFEKEKLAQLDRRIERKQGLEDIRTKDRNQNKSIENENRRKR